MSLDIMEESILANLKCLIEKQTESTILSTLKDLLQEYKNKTFSNDGAYCFKPFILLVARQDNPASFDYETIFQLYPTLQVADFLVEITLSDTLLKITCNIANFIYASNKKVRSLRDRSIKITCRNLNMFIHEKLDLIKSLPDDKFLLFLCEYDKLSNYVEYVVCDALSKAKLL